nr:transposase [Mesorhizobium sp. 131-3-5]
MWPISRRRPSAIPSDLTHEEWSRIQPFLPGAAKTGRRVVTDLREVLNAIRYMARSDGGWHAAKGFPAHIGRGRDALRTCPRTAPTGWNVRRPDGEAAGADQGAERRIRHNSKPRTSVPTNWRPMLTNGSQGRLRLHSLSDLRRSRTSDTALSH